ncbi:hypothetical protein IDJ77_20745 [Mucilaginibacter sp. ZT4R22]|uniref:Uncharacterized protein n=1 Tax=Mucilaginibacter pankratovii TaxID=2772110 RepID=A0ABR7WVD1_9SPHI|nr:hypothetical protein [Mucilaginibacter pankratovii]MBD1366253.1 hypothetical protein [Mucilaginibacter pankratovii]
MASSTEKTGDKSDGAVKPAASKEKELKTEGPLSEKDEVKKAESEMTKAAKKKA